MDLKPQPQLYSTESGEAINADPAHIPQLLASGKAAFKRGEVIPAIDADGRPTGISAEEAPDAFAQGYSYEPIASQTQRALKDTYGKGLGNELRAGAEGVARGLVPGADYAMEALGADKEGLAARKEYNPVSATTGEVLGFAAPALLTLGETAALRGSLEAAGVASKAALKKMAPETVAELAAQSGISAGKLGTAAAIARKTPAGLITEAGGAVSKGVEGLVGSEGTKTLASRIMQSAIPAAAGSAVEGAMYGAADSLSEAALGDPEEVADKALSNIGVSALYGGVLGLGIGGAVGALGKFLPSGEAKAIKEGISETTSSSPSPISMAAGDLGEAPASLNEIKNRVEMGKMEGINPTELPSKKRLQDVDKIIGDSQFPVHEIQLRSMDDPNLRELYKAVKESPQGKELREYEGYQKLEGVRQLNDTLGKITPAEVTPDPYKGGQQMVDAFKEIYETNKTADKEIFQKIKEISPKLKISGQDVVQSMRSAIPEVNSLFNVAEDGTFSLKKYSEKMPVSDRVYGAVKSVFDNAANGEVTAQELRNLRDNLSTKLPKIDSEPVERMQVGRLKKSLMDLLEGEIQKVSPDTEVREAFKKYAINEQNRDALEKVFGGKFSDQESLLRQIKPENVGDNVFRNSATLQVAKDILPPETFNKLLGNHIAEQINKFTDNGAFSSKRFATWLKNENTNLQIAFKDRPDLLQRISALTDKMKILPDAAPLNPPNTAKAIGLFRTIEQLGSKAKNIGEFVSNPLKGSGEFIKFLGDKIESGGRLAELESALKKADVGQEIRESQRHYTILKRLEETAQKTSAQIGDAAKAFFSKAPSIATFGAAKKRSFDVSDEREDNKKFFQKNSEKLAQIAANPEQAIDHVARALQPLASVAPNAANAMSERAMRAASYLYEKMPKNPNAGAYITQKKWAPSDYEISKWKLYVDAVNNPMSAIKELKNGHMNFEQADAIRNVYPTLYGELVGKITEELSKLKDELPYQKKLQLGTLFQIPTDPSLAPNFIAEMQMAHMESSQTDANNQGGQKVSGARADKLKLADKSMTNTQRVMTRA